MTFLIISKQDEVQWYSRKVPDNENIFEDLSMQVIQEHMNKCLTSSWYRFSWNNEGKKSITGQKFS